MNQHPPSIIVQLVHIHGPMKGEIQEFAGNEIFIGRHPSCDLQFPKDLVAISRKHAHIVREGNRFKLVDSSTNGTFVNGIKIDQSWLKDGDVIFFTEGGPKVSFLTRQGETISTPLEDLRPSHRQVDPVLSAPPPLQAQPLTEPRPQSSMPPTTEPLQGPPITAPLQSSPPQPISRPEPPSVMAQEIRVETVRAPLVIQYGPILQSFNELPVTMGSGTDCDLTLDHPSLLHHHLQVFFAQGSYRIKDLTGQNLIQINHQSVSSPSVLSPGDKLYLTQAGPGFQFMEGGRMMEIEMANPVTSEAQKNESSEGNPEPPEEKSGSFFKKLFK